MNQLPPGVKSDCSICYRRPSKEGGSGSCPFSPTVRRAFRGGGGKGEADCSSFSDRRYVGPKLKRVERDRPQDEGLF